MKKSTALKFPKLHRAMRLNDEGISASIVDDLEQLDLHVTMLYRWISVLIILQCATLAYLVQRFA